MENYQINRAIRSYIGQGYHCKKCGFISYLNSFGECPYCQLEAPFVQTIVDMDFENSLENMHSAELWLCYDDPHSFGCYCSNLYTNVENSCCATARQRAKWFLKTIGRWEEKKEENK